MRKNILFAIVALLLISVTYFVLQLFMPLNIIEPIEIQLKKGITYRQAAELMKEKGIIRDKNVFILLARLQHLDRKLRAGYYAFQGRISTWETFKTVLSGKIIQMEAAIIEGDSFFEIRRKLAESKIMSKEDFNRLFKDRNFMKSLDIDAPSLEGYLYPDTYLIPKGTPPEEVLETMVSRLKFEYNDEFKWKTKELKMNENDVLTLASIIEKEARVDEERPIISAVYHNRLKRRMPLQADPTAIYGIKPFSSGVKSADLKNKTAYNTYKIKGLPPGPIASAGLKSIRAALYPAAVPYIYFVSQNNGTHRFSSTIKEHNRAVAEYRKKKSAERQMNEN